MQTYGLFRQNVLKHIIKCVKIKVSLLLLNPYPDYTLNAFYYDKLKVA